MLLSGVGSLSIVCLIITRFLRGRLVVFFLDDIIELFKDPIPLKCFRTLSRSELKPRDLFASHFDTKEPFTISPSKIQKQDRSPAIPYSSPKTSATMVHLTAPDHAKAVNLARRFTAQNENDLMRKSTEQITDLFVTQVCSHLTIPSHSCRGESVW